VRGASITGPSAGTFAIDNGNASAINLGNNSGAAPINIGTANAGAVSIGRAATTTVVNGPLSILGAAVTGPTSGTFSIDNGNASPINIGTANAGQISIGRGTQATVVNSTLQSVGDFTVGSPVKLTITAATGDVAGNGLGTFGGGLANQIRLSGSATTAPVVMSALGSDTNIGITLTPKGTGRVAVAANGLDVTGTLTATSTISNTAGGISITGNSTIVGQLTSLTGLTSSGTITFSGLTTGLVYNSSGVLSQVGNGTAGQVLMSNGASAPT